MPPDALAEKPERDEADLRSAARSAAGALKEAIDAFVEVRVVTAIGAQALSEDLVRCWYEMRDLQPPAANPPAADAFKDVIGAVTRINMATGDISVSYATEFAAAADLKALHDANVAQGQKIFRDNIETLRKLVVELFDKVAGQPPGG